MCTDSYWHGQMSTGAYLGSAEAKEDVAERTVPGHEFAGIVS